MSVNRQLEIETARELQLHAELETVRARVAYLRRRLAVAAFQESVLHDVLAQKHMSLLDEALQTFKASLQPPKDFDRDAEGDYEDTDEFADIRGVDSALDTALVKAIELIQSNSDDIASFNGGMTLLLCVSHFVARCSEFIDDDAARLSDAQRAMEDLRGDVTQVWYEVADQLHATAESKLREQWIETSMGILQDDCGEYFTAAAKVLVTVGTSSYRSHINDE
jgi:hypothetical protein